MPCHLSNIAARCNQTILKRNFLDPQLFCNFLCKQRTNNEAEPPVQVGYQHRNKGNHPNCMLAALRNGSQTANPLFHYRGICNCRAGNNDQSHLHRKGEQLPESLTPMADHLNRSLLRKRNSENQRNYRQDNSKDACIWHVF